MSTDVDPDPDVRVDPERVLRPLHTTRRSHYALLALFGLGTLWLLFAWILQLRGGLYATTSLGDWGISAGVPWGLYIGAFIWWIGIAHGGIAVSAAVRVFNIRRFSPIARIAELLTVFALGMAAFNIIADIARPERVFNTIVQWPLTFHHSPLAWDIAVVTLYLVLSLTYLTLSLRNELHAMRERLPGHLRPVYAVVLLGYRPEESEKVQQMLWWLAVAILALIPLLSGGVVPWLFGLVGDQPGWFGAAAGPSMLIESLTSAIAFVIIVAAIFRYAYGWQEMIDDSIFRDLSKVLAFFTIATIWFVIHDLLTGIYMAPAHIAEITETVLWLPFFWVAMAGLIAVFVYLGLTVLRPELFSVPGVTIAAIVVAISILNKKVMFVVEGLMHPTYPPLRNLYPTGAYFPNWIEWSIVLGTLFVVGLGFVIVSKIIPLIELEEALEREQATDGQAVEDDVTTAGDPGREV